MAKTKIVCTIGIGTNANEENIRNIANAGMDVARLNGSYFFGEEESFKKRIELIRKIDDSIPILLDIPGPKIRTKMTERISLKQGDKISFFYEKHADTSTIKKIEVTGPLDHAEKGDTILVDDANLEFKILDVKDGLVICEIINEGTLIHGKGVNFPNNDLSGNYLKKRDEKLIEFAKEMKLDFIGASFVREREDIKKIKKLLSNSEVKIISKIETKAALKNLDEIILESDGIMIDRGDLSAETKMEHLPILQKEIIKAANKNGKPIIIATELLNNMIEHAKPTKAEISDIANAVLDGASALMLSGETAVGTRPSESVKTMKSIIENTEELLDYKLFDYNLDEHDISNSICKSIYHISNQLNVRKIVCITKTSYTPMMISRFKPSIPIVAVTSAKNVSRELRLVWGVVPFYHADVESGLKKTLEKMVKTGSAKENELVVLTTAEEICGELRVNSLTVKEISKIIS